MKAQELTLPIDRTELADILRSHGVRTAYVFGSYARGEQRTESDFDLFVQYKDGVSLFDHFDLKELLEARTGQTVDLVSKIHPSFQPYIESDLVELPL